MLIEVIGVPGAGKSTILEKLFRNSEIKRDFVNWKQVKKNAILDCFNKNKIITKIDLLKYRMIFSLPVFNTQLVEYFLYKKIKYRRYLYNNDWGIVTKIILDGIICDDMLLPCMKPYYINLILEYIIRTRILKEYSSNMGENIIFENGIICAINSLDYIYINKKYFKKHILPDAVIFVKAEICTIVNVAETRKKEGKQRIRTLNKDKEEIFRIYENSLNKYTQISDILLSKGIPVIEFDRNDEPENLINKLILLKNSYIRNNR